MGYFYLIVSILLNTVWAVCYKIAVRRKCNINSVNLFVQVGAATVLFVFWAVSGMNFHPKAAALAAVTGVLMCAAALAFFYHMRTGVLAISWTIIGLSVVFPVAVSIAAWHEQPTLSQWIGLALIPAAFACLGGSADNSDQVK